MKQYRKSKANFTVMIFPVKICLQFENASAVDIFLTKALTTKSTSSTYTAPLGTIRKHLSKARSCQMELTAGPERGGSLGTESQVDYTSVPPASGKSRSVPEDGGVQPVHAGQGQVPAHLHIPMPHPRAPSPQGQTL